jgi:RimJ/RimL family protein N-acetyltransferase
MRSGIARAECRGPRRAAVKLPCPAPTAFDLKSFALASLSVAPPKTDPVRPRFARRFTICLVSVRLETGRLIIRPFEDGDADAWIAMFSDPEVRRFLPPAPVPTMETFARAIESRHAMEREIGYAMWAVDEMRTGTFIGQCGIRPAKSMDENAGSEIDLAYHFARTSWSKGYATEAAIAVLAHGLGPIGLDSIMAVVVPENVGSWHVMEKVGMRYQGLADYYGLKGLKKYVAEREWWSSPLVP